MNIGRKVLRIFRPSSFANSDGLSVSPAGRFTLRRQRSKLVAPSKVLVTVVKCIQKTLSVLCLTAALVFSGYSRSPASLRRDSYWNADASMSEKPRTTRLRTGSWGGQHISLEVTARQTTIEYDCARATIDQAIVLDRHGRFSVSGRQFPEHGGPVRQEDEEGYPARFSGEVKGNSMTLKIENSATRELIGNFTVVYGAQPRLFKCK